MHDSRSKALIEAELDFERQVAKSRGLASFRRNATAWELLMILASQPEGYTEGLHEIPAATGTRYLGRSALLKFVRSQRDAGLIEFLEHEKRSKRILRIRPDLVQELVRLLERRYAAKAEALSAADPAPEPVVSPAPARRRPEAAAGQALSEAAPA
jgi:hypothetical protein